jgi:hypothetical protein
MSSDEARRALPKIISFVRGFQLQPLLTKSSVVDLAFAREPKFAKFLTTEFQELTRFPEKFNVSLEGAALSAESIALKNCVPFSRFTDKGIIIRAFQEESKSTRKAIWTGIKDGFAALGVSGAAALVALIVGRRMRLKSAAFEKTRADIQARETEIEEGKYKGIDQQQSELGDVDIAQFNKKP